MLYDVTTKYEHLFEGYIGNWKTKPVDIELHPGSKTYH